MDVCLPFILVLLTLGNFSVNAKSKNVKNRLSVLENKLKIIEGRLGLCESKHDMIREHSERLSAIEIHLNGSVIEVGGESSEKEFDSDSLTPKTPMHAEPDFKRILEAFHQEKWLNALLIKEISNLKDIVNGVNKTLTQAVDGLSDLKAVVSDVNTVVTKAVDDIHDIRNDTEVAETFSKQIDREFLTEVKTEIEKFNSSIVSLTQKLNEMDKCAEKTLDMCKNVENKTQIVKASPASSQESVNDYTTESVVNLTQQMKKIESIATPASCKEILDGNSRDSGVYTVYPGKQGVPVRVFCDMETDDGGWTVFQRRKDGSENFERDWHSYKRGFGKLEGEFWLGNKYVSELTEGCCYELRIDMEDFEGRRGYAKYGTFQMLPEAEKYKLIVGNYSGNAGDSLTSLSDMAFTTKDRDNDEWSSGNCAKLFKGGWWYDHECSYSNLNGLYLNGNTSYENGIVWLLWKQTYYYSLKQTEIKYRKILT